ncbi:MAG: ABC transporter substrate-binding protein, partial [Acetobacteraceae bacterium]|nr:ABC transporter substrate-binding protein [Acetobacteraceae bacterium]
DAGGATADEAARTKAYDAALHRITEQAYIVPMHTYVSTYAFQKQLDFPTFPDELPRFYLAKWK